MDSPVSKMVKVQELEFDRQNPRLTEMDVSASTPDEEIIRILWDAMDVRELVLSIEASGFFRHEPLIVEEGTRVVMEGNRRLAAVRVLLEPGMIEELQAHIPSLPPSAKEALQKIPVVQDSRENAWRYLGFKHVNGPAKWSSYAKSCYIAEVHRDYHVSLEDIARQIGDTHRTVQRLFQGLMVKEQAEKARVFDIHDRWNNHFSFSHLYTGITYSGISEFIGLLPEEEERQSPVPSGKTRELGELFLWLYGSRKEEKPPVIQSQNPHLRQLDKVVAHPEALTALRAGRPLDMALEISRPPTTVFRESLMNSKQALQQARALLTTGYNESAELLAVAGEVADLAYDLYQDMVRKRRPGPQRRQKEED